MNKLSLSVPNPVHADRLQSLISCSGNGPVLITTHYGLRTDTNAGGQIPVEGFEVDDLVEQITRRFLTLVGESGPGFPLLNKHNRGKE